MALEIIGPGFGRTGTNSLKLALEHLGFGPCHHMFEVRDNPDRLADWEALARGEKLDWDKVFHGYRSQVASFEVRLLDGQPFTEIGKSEQGIELTQARHRLLRLAASS